MSRPDPDIAIGIAKSVLAPSLVPRAPMWDEVVLHEPTLGTQHEAVQWYAWLPSLLRTTVPPHNARRPCHHSVPLPRIVHQETSIECELDSLLVSTWPTAAKRRCDVSTERHQWPRRSSPWMDTNCMPMVPMTMLAYDSESERNIALRFPFPS